MGSLRPQPELLNANLLFNKIPPVICMHIKVKKNCTLKELMVIQLRDIFIRENM